MTTIEERIRNLKELLEIEIEKNKSLKVNTIEVELFSFDFQANTITFQLSAEQMAKGFRCGKAVINLSEIQGT